MQVIKDQVLKEISKLKEGRKVCAVLSKRERASKFTNTDMLRSLLKTEYKTPVEDELEYAKVWKLFRSAGAGQILGPRFKWAGYTPSSIAARVLDPKNKLQAASFRKRKKKSDSIVEKKPTPKLIHKQEQVTQMHEKSGDRIFAMFMTQEGKLQELILPGHLTETDRENLIKLLGKIPVKSAS